MMVESAPRDFAKMVSIVMCLEEGVREGRLNIESVLISSSKKKVYEVNMVKGQPRHQAQKALQYDSIPMKYAELLPSLLEGNLVQTRLPPPIPNKLSAR